MAAQNLRKALDIRAPEKSLGKRARSLAAPPSLGFLALGQGANSSRFFLGLCALLTGWGCANPTQEGGVGRGYSRAV